MMRYPLAAALALAPLVLTACAGGEALGPIPAHHPANPNAPAAPLTLAASPADPLPPVTTPAQPMHMDSMDMDSKKDMNMRMDMNDAEGGDHDHH